MIPLTFEKNQSYHKQKVCHIWKKEFSTDNDNKKNHKVIYYYHFAGKYRWAAYDICNLRYKIRKEIPVVFHNGST